MNNHLSVYEFDPMRIKLVIVAHGAGLKFFLEDLSGTAVGEGQDRSATTSTSASSGLSKFGVEVYLCQITYKRQNIDLAKTRKDRVPEIRALRRRLGRGIAGQGLCVSEGGVGLGDATSASLHIHAAIVRFQV